MAFDDSPTPRPGAGVAPPPLDIESSAALAAVPPAEGWTTDAEFVSSLRSFLPFDATDEELRASGKTRVSNYETTTADGHVVPLLVCTPVGPAYLRPALFFVHGGGMVSGSGRTGLLEVVKLAERLDAVVVSVSYRLSPEHPDPAPLSDCCAGLVAVMERSDEMGVDPDRVVIVGSSAGATLAAGTTLVVRDRHQFTLVGQLLMNPMLDDSNNSFSSHQMVDVDPWNREANAAAWRAFSPQRRADGADGYGVPARADDLSGLPPTFLDVGSVETLRDETVEYANRIWQAGGYAELHVWPGGFHGYEFVAAHSRLAQETWDTRLNWLRRMLAE